VLKDRHSRSGLLKSELERKRGAGAHNWGSFAQEGQYESLADADAQRDIGDLDASDLVNNEGDEAELNADADADVLADLPSDQGGIGGTADETGINPDVPKDFTRETARAIVDANGVARSPTDSTSSLDSARGGQRRKSSVSEEEREKARLYRERAMHKGGECGGDESSMTGIRS
jgi:hypothetical protein